MSVFFTPHARKRALERYGLSLSIQDLSGIMKQCERGDTLRQSEGHGTVIYIVYHNGVRMLPMVTVGDPPMLVTFLPPDAMQAGSKRRHLKRTGAAKQMCRTPDALSRKVYRRENLRVRDVEADW